MPEHSITKRIAKNTIFLYLRMIVVLVVSLYTSRVILATLGAIDYGIYNVVGGIVAIMSFLGGALGASTSRFLTYDLGVGDQEKLNKTFSAALNLHIVVSILVIIFGETLGVWFLKNKLVIPEERLLAAFWVLQASIVTTAINFTQVPYTASIISHEEMSIYAYVGLYETGAKLLIAYLIGISSHDALIEYAFLLMFNTVTISLIYRLYTKKKYQECRVRLIKEKGLYSKLLKYTGWELFGGIAIVSQGQGISIALNMFFGPIVNAARGITQQLSGAITQFVTNFLLASRPQVIKYCAEKRYAEMYDLTFRTAKFSYLMMLAIVIPFCFEIDFILKIWLGESVPDYTNIFAIIVLITGLVSSLHTASLMPYHAIGKLNIGNGIGGILMFLALPLTVVFFKTGLPPYWAFIAIFITNSFQQLITWVVVHKYVPFDYSDLFKDVYRPIGMVTSVSAIIPLTIRCLMNQGWARFFVLLISTELALAVNIYAIAMTCTERTRLKQFIYSKIYGKFTHCKR